MSSGADLSARIRQLARLTGAHELNKWESAFVGYVYAITDEGSRIERLNEYQIEKLDQLWTRICLNR